MVMGKFQAGSGEDPSARPPELTPEEISQWMDGELDAERARDRCRGEALLANWERYHRIGDHLRGCGELSAGFTPRLLARLAAEPTVLAPRRRPTPATVAWALAAGVAAVGVVGWVALTTMSVPPPTAVATAQQGSATAAGEVRRPVLNEYLLAHQEYSPTTAIQGVRPYLRAVATDKPDAPE